MSVIHGFELLREEHVPEVNSTARIYRHIRSGAELLSLINTDENKVFGITFRTPPVDSTGVAHIMEHSVLGGSRKYPVKEPFVELMKGSLNTFLNAMTYPDKTCYPVASQNLQDFYNLVDVYLDAVFYPTLDPFTLKQEGWHYELESSDGEMTFKGVVFNEMKGAYSSPDSVLDEMSQRSIFPDTNYHVDSGGDPERIPDLTYTQFVDFHRRYYHPSNARIFFYGDDNPEKRLELLDAYLNAFEAQPVDSLVPLQPAFRQPVRHVHPYEVGDDDPNPRHWITLNWLLPEGGDAELSLGLGILENILIGNPAAPLRKALIDSGLGENLTGRGLETGLRQMFFSTGLKGVEAANVDRVESLIQTTLHDLANRGIDPNTVAAALNTVEFRMREYNTGSYPRGLLVMLNSLETWLFGGDPLQPLRFEGPLAAIKTKIASGERFFEDLIRRHLLENPHRTTVILQPDADLARRRNETENARLAAARAQMSADDVQQVVADTLELQRRQEAVDSPEALATIPSLQRADLEPTIRTIPSELIEANGQPPVLVHDLFTNGILYLDLGFDLHALPAEWLPYVPLFGRALLETGTDRENFVQLVQHIGRTTGGIHQASLTSAALNRERGQAWFLLRGKAMLPQTGDLLGIIGDVLRTARLDDRERIRQMALESRAGLESHLADRGHAVVGSRLRARFSESDWAAEQMGGVSYLFFLRELIERIDTDWPSVQTVLEGIRARLINRNSAICNITVNADGFTQVRGAIESFLGGLPDAPVEIHPWPLLAATENEGLTIRAQVNYVGKGGSLYAAGYQPHGSAHVIVNYLRSTWLWNKVRVQGGAYGGFCTFDRQSGVFTFLSYRDPNLTSTLRSYDETVDFLASLEIDDDELTRAIIGTIGEIDAYMLPDAKGYTALTRHLLGIHDAERQKNRSEILNTSMADFRAFAQTLAAVREHGDVVVLGSEEAITAAEKDGVRLKLVKVL